MERYYSEMVTKAVYFEYVLQNNIYFRKKGRRMREVRKTYSLWHLELQFVAECHVWYIIYSLWLPVSQAVLQIYLKTKNKEMDFDLDLRAFFSF